MYFLYANTAGGQQSVWNDSVLKYTVSKKKQAKTFFVISPIKLGTILMKFGAPFPNIIQVRWGTFTSFWSKFIPETVYQISSESPKF